MNSCGFLDSWFLSAGRCCASFGWLLDKSLVDAYQYITIVVCDTIDDIKLTAFIGRPRIVAPLIYDAGKYSMKLKLMILKLLNSFFCLMKTPIVPSVSSIQLRER